MSVDMKVSCLAFIFALCLIAATAGAANPQFSIDYENNTFVKDGQPFRYISGSLHYFRVPEELWLDRLLKYRAAGLNAVQTYIEWKSHEKEPGTFDFKGRNDIVKFVKLAKELDMVVIIRPGPYIDAERDMGGLPYWLLRVNKDMKLRTNDPSYLKYVDRWFSVLLPKLVPLLYENGGPIISFQVENEYGSYYACDFQYTAHMRDLLRKYLGNKTILFTTDGAGYPYISCGQVADTYTAVDFGSGGNVSESFAIMRTFQPRGPLLNSEFYPGWLDHWGQSHANVNTAVVAQTLDEILSMGANVNIYMFHGGTSFGFESGSNFSPFQACPTSYDYNAPLNEAGDPTDKFFAIQKVIKKYLTIPPFPIVAPKPKMTIPSFQLELKMPLLESVRQSSKPAVSPDPLTFEDMIQSDGFLLYEKVIPNMVTDPALLEIPGIRDRGYVYVDSNLQGILSREQGITTLPVKILPGQNLTILVENQGRICFGKDINDFKGIVGDVKLAGHVLKNWTTYNVDLNPTSLRKLRFYDSIPGATVPAIYVGTFDLPSQYDPALDTFLKVDGWHKGVAFLNGHNLGRYWPIEGPQVTLYAPAPYFIKQNNVFTLLELEHAPCGDGESCSAEFVAAPIIDGTVPS